MPLANWTPGLGGALGRGVRARAVPSSRPPPNPASSHFLTCWAVASSCATASWRRFSESRSIAEDCTPTTSWWRSYDRNGRMVPRRREGREPGVEPSASRRFRAPPSGSHGRRDRRHPGHHHGDHGRLKGRRCYPVASLEAAEIRQRLPNRCCAGELGGNMPFAFDLQNSPSELVARTERTVPSRCCPPTVCN